MSIEWHPYPQEKPHWLRFYLVTEKFGEVLMVGALFYCGKRNGFGVNDVIAWAELPKPYSGT